MDRNRFGACTSLGLTAIALLACGGADGQPESGSAVSSGRSYPRFEGSAAYDLVRRQVEFGPRVPGTEPHRAMADWLDGYLRERAGTLIVQRFDHVTREGETIPLFNFLARFRPAAGASTLLIAHWDTRPTADSAPDPEDRDEPIPGANDGASGTAVLLQLADMLAKAPPPGAIDLLLVDGEDYGDFGVGEDVFLGSRHFAENMPDGFEASFGVLLDMVGDRNLDIYIEGNSNRLAPEVVDRVWDLAARLGFGDIFHREVGYTLSDDHIPLNEAGIPTIDVIDFDYDYWHTLQDTVDKVSASSLEVVGTVMTRLVYAAR